jgi:hypothetical protein
MEDQINFVFDIWDSFGFFNSGCSCIVIQPGQLDIVGEKLIVVIKPPPD